jgi:hypothetical protein
MGGRHEVPGTDVTMSLVILCLLAILVTVILLALAGK